MKFDEDKIEKYKNLERHMLAMRKFFTEYFRRTTCGIMDSKDDISFLELKGLAAFNDEKEDFTPSEISRAIHLPLPNITAIINRLEKKRIVEKKRDAKDGRIIRVSLTQKGRSVRLAFMKKRRVEIESILEKLNEDEQKELLKCLERATEIFQKIK